MYSMVIILQVHSIRGLVQSPCGKISVIMTLGGEGVLAHDVMVNHTVYYAECMSVVTAYCLPELQCTKQ